MVGKNDTDHSFIDFKNGNYTEELKTKLKNENFNILSPEDMDSIFTILGDQPLLVLKT